MTKEDPSVEESGIDELSFAYLIAKKETDRSRISTILTALAPEWSLKLQSNAPGWPDKVEWRSCLSSSSSINNNNNNKNTLKTIINPALTLFLLSASPSPPSWLSHLKLLSNNSSESLSSPSFALERLDGLARQLPCECLGYLHRFFSARTIYSWRQVQMKLRDQLIVSHPAKSGFITRHILESDEVDDEIELGGDLDQRLWKSCSVSHLVARLFQVAATSALELQHIACQGLPMDDISAPLFQLLDDASNEYLDQALEVVQRLLERLHKLKQGSSGTEKKSEGGMHYYYFLCVLLEALINRHWTLSISANDAVEERARMSHATKIISNCDRLLEYFHLDSSTGGDAVNTTTWTMYQTYLDERDRFQSVTLRNEFNSKPAVASSKKTSETRIYPDMPYLAKSEVFWCTLLQTAYSLRTREMRKFNWQFIRKYAELFILNSTAAGLSACAVIRRNFKSLLKLVSVYSCYLSDPALTLEMFQFMRTVCMPSIGTDGVVQYEGDLLVLLIEFGDFLSKSEVNETLSGHFIGLKEFYGELGLTLDSLIETLLRAERTESLKSDWEAIQEELSDKIDYEWAVDSFERLFSNAGK